MKAIRALLSLIFSKILIFFGHKYDISVIPQGQYCYTPDHKKNELNKGSFSYYVIPCPYFKRINKRWNGCNYLGMITDDFVFGDQCKSCGINSEYKEDEEGNELFI